MFFDRLMFWELWAHCALSSVKMTRSYYFVETKFLIGTRSLKTCLFPLYEITGARTHLWNSVSSLPTLPLLPEVQSVTVQESHFENSPTTLLLPSSPQLVSICCLCAASGEPLTLYAISCVCDSGKPTLAVTEHTPFKKKGENQCVRVYFSKIRPF